VTNEPSSLNLQVSDDLGKLTAVAQAKHLAVGLALGDILYHAMAAGDALLAIRELVPEGQWQAHLRAHTDIPERTARVYVQVAKARPILERQSSAGPLSIAAALQYLRDPRKSGKRSSASKAKTKPASFDALAWWLGAPIEARRHFLDGAGISAFLAALPPAWRTELGRRAAGQRTASSSKLGNTLTSALRTALSLQSSALTDQPAVGVANALNGILNRLASESLELHDVEIVIAAAMRRAA
jgi:tryptophanyl-tRNA synthetase